MEPHAQPSQHQQALLVEDDDISQITHRFYLEKLGFQVDLAETGYTALELAAQKDYRCILLDIGLPDITGEAVLAAIRYREQKTVRHVPIIVNSAHADDALLQCCHALGADATLKKPLMSDDLSRALSVVDGDVGTHGIQSEGTAGK